jgi:cellulose biosynthesis protein BcsQ
MAKTIAVANYKGGSGKSTVAMMLAEGLSLYHKARVLAVDLDPLAVLSNMLMSVEGVQSATEERRTFRDILRQLAMGKQPQLARFMCTKVSDLIELRDARDGRRIDLIPSTTSLLKHLDEVETQIRVKFPSEPVDRILARMLGKEFGRMEQSYDYVVFDCPAGPVPQTVAALRLSGLNVAPTVLENNSMTALKAYFRDIETKDGSLPTLPRYVLPVMFIASNTEQRALLDQLIGGLYGPHFSRAVPHNTAIQRAVMHPGRGSFRSAQEKYGSALNEVKALASNVLSKLPK